MPDTPLTLVLAALTVLGAVAPVAAVGLGASALGATPTPTDNGTAVNVTPGAQLSTVLAATEVTTRGEIEDARFEFEFERATESERAEAVADRAEALAERARDIREDYEEATAAREAGELTADEYARRLAELNARATRLLSDVDALRAHAANVSSLELAAAGMNRTALRIAVDDLDPLSGVGATALLQHFLGESTGAVELRTADGLRVEVEGEDGERSLEVRRPRDDDGSITVSQDSALQTARSTLPPGNWSLLQASVHPDSGYYRFEFALDDATRTGEAEVRVDGSSGEVFRLEVETERGETDRDDDESEDDEAEDGELVLLLVDGTPAPSETVTVRAQVGGQPVEGLTVFVNDRAVAETDADGEAALRLPRAREIEVVAGDAELEFEFDDLGDGESVSRRLDVNATLDDGAVTVRVTFEGSPVAGATVFADGDRVGETRADGVVRFALEDPEADDLRIELVKGEFEAEFRYDVRDGQLELTESAVETDGTDDDDSSGSGSGGEATETPEPTETPESGDDG